MSRSRNLRAGRAQAMIEQGRHPRYAYNTLKKQREEVAPVVRLPCDVCGLPDLHNGQGDGYGSCDCHRCDCGAASGSGFCSCPPDAPFDACENCGSYWEDCECQA